MCSFNENYDEIANPRRLQEDTNVRQFAFQPDIPTLQLEYQITFILLKHKQVLPSH